MNACAELEQLILPGRLFSYCNAGFVVLGRLVEVLRGRPFHIVLKERLCDPLALAHTVTLPEEEIMFRVAIGHMVQPPDRTPVRAAKWAMPWCQTPAGSTACSTVADMLRFARAVMNGDGKVISEASASAMLKPQQSIPGAVPGLQTSMGLGWALSEWHGIREAGHTGSTLGQAAALSIIAERRLAIAVLTNSLTGIALLKPLLDDIRSVLGLARTPNPSIPNPQPDMDLNPCTGIFSRRGQLIEVEARSGRLVITTKATGQMQSLAPELPSVTVFPVDEQTFVGPGYGLGMPMTVYFAERDQNGAFRYILLGRAAQQ